MGAANISLPEGLAELARVPGYVARDLYECRRCGIPATVAEILQRHAGAKWRAVILAELLRWQVHGGVRVERRSASDERCEAVGKLVVTAVALQGLLGPQWVDILELARILDCPDDPLAESEAQRWSSMTWITAVGVASRAAIEHNRSRNLDAAHHIAHCLGTGMHRLAGADAMQALVVRDIVGAHGLTAIHFEYLVEPWSRVHPDWEHHSLAGTGYSR